MSGTATDTVDVGSGRARELLPGAIAGVAFFALALFDGSQTPLATSALTVGVWWTLALLLLIAPRPVRLAPPALVAIAALTLTAVLCAASAAWAADDGRVYVEVVRACGYLGVLLLLIAGVRAGDVRAVLAGVAVAIAGVALLALGSRLAPGLLTGDATFLREFPEAVRGRLYLPDRLLERARRLHGRRGRARHLARVAGGLPPGPSAGRRRAATAAADDLSHGVAGGLLAAILGVVVLLALIPMRVRALAGLALGAGGGLDARARRVGRPGASSRGSPADRTYAVGILALAVTAAVFGLRFASDEALQRPHTPGPLRGRSPRGGRGRGAGRSVRARRRDRAGRRDPRAEPSTTSAVVSSRGRFLAVGSNGRLQLWETAIDAFESEPLHGIGAGAFGFYWNRHGTLAEPARDAHSLFLESLAELGPLGLLAVLGLFGSGAWAAARLTFGDRDGTVAALAGLLGAGAAGAAVDWTWEIPAAFGLVLLAVGLLSGPLSASAAPAPAGRGPRRGPALRIAGAAGALALVAVAGALLLSERSLDRSRELASEGDLAGAAAAARDAARLQPGSEQPWLQLGQVQVLAGDNEAGAESFREAVERSPDSVQANLALAVALHSIGDPGADEQQERTIALLPAER